MRNILFIIIGTLIALFFLARVLYQNTRVLDFFSSSFIEQGVVAEEEAKSFFPSDAPSAKRSIFFGLVEPVDSFAKRVSKKPFGIFVSPENSPVSPERFRGYHTGVDAEIFMGEEKKNIFVSAVADGTVVSVRFATGYGGLVVIEHEIKGSVPNIIEGKKIYGIYGHIRLSSIIIRSNDFVKAGDIIGVLGEAYSDDTGGERKHLHFGLFSAGADPAFGGQFLNSIPDIRGYVERKEELQNWLNPLQFF